MLGQVLLDGEEDDGKIWKVFFCPGCNIYHQFQLNQNMPIFWEWDGNNEYPTFTPSIIIKIFDDVICHLQIIDGMIHYFSDCKHELNDLTIPMCEA